LIVPASNPDVRRAKPGRHRIKPGTPLPGFGRVGATPDHYTVQTILRRHNREVLTDEQAEGLVTSELGGTEVG
jgi:hypothetical protein